MTDTLTDEQKRHLQAVQPYIGKRVLVTGGLDSHTQMLVTPRWRVAPSGRINMMCWRLNPGAVDWRPPHLGTHLNPAMLTILED